MKELVNTPIRVCEIQPGGILPYRLLIDILKLLARSVRYG